MEAATVDYNKLIFLLFESLGRLFSFERVENEANTNVEENQDESDHNEGFEQD